MAPLTKCPQCGSRDCGPVRCRFSNVKHEIYRWNQGADQIKQDREQPEWLRNLLTGGKDIPVGR